jgi:outer membrane protein OmpA-like peptidoglycan-associated protein
LILEIGVHTDWRGSAASNLDLSQRRANVVVDCMVREYGIDSTQVKAVGYGREKPRLVYWCNNNYWAYLNDSLSAFCPEPELIELNNDYINQHKANKLLFERLHQFNRRVEVKIVGIRE